METREKRDHENPRNRRRPHRGAVAALPLLLISVLLPAIFPASGRAHSPQDVVLSYDQTRHMLEVRITHASKDPAAHYVKKVEIRRADKTIATTGYESQPGEATFAYVYPVEIGAGEVLEVTVTCSVFGSKTAKLDMRKTPR